MANYVRVLVEKGLGMARKRAKSTMEGGSK